MSALDVETSISVAVAPPVAWQIISDFSRNPQWQKGMRSCTWITEPPVAVGSRYEQHARFLGKDVLTTFEVTELEPGRRVTINSVQGTFPITVTRTVTADGAGCMISAHVRGDAGGLFGLMSPIMKPLVKRSVKGDYRRLKALLES